MNVRLSAFITVSGLVHAGLFWSAQQAAPPILNIGGEARALRVTLDTAAPRSGDKVTTLAALETPPAVAAPVSQGGDAPQRSATTANESRVPVRPHHTDESHATPKPPRSTTDRTAARQQPQASTEPPPPQTSSVAVSARVSAALQNQLAEVFDYPWLARKRGWEGRVTLSLHVAEDGALSDWKVTQTSGYRVLDRSALQAAQRIGRLQQAERLLNGRSLNLSIPVRYRLLDG